MNDRIDPGDDERIRVLEFVNGFAVGGTERQVVNLGRALNRERFDLRVACLRRWGHYLEEMESCDAPIAEYPIDSLRNLRTARQQWRLAGDLKRDRIQVVHTYNFYPNVFALPVARLSGTPVIVASIRDMGLYLTPGQRRAQNFVCHLADRILVNAEAVRRWLLDEGFPAGRIEVIPNGIDMARFAAPRGAGRIRCEIGLPESAPVVAVLGRLHAMKGVEYFLQAAAIVSRRFPEARFLIVGDRLAVRDGVVVSEQSDRTGLLALADSLGLAGRLVFTGFRLDIPELLAEIDLSVLPSLSEGLSNVLLESMAAGVPVVATRVGGTPEALEEGLSGLLVPPRDAAALAEAISRLLGDPALAHRLGQGGRRRIARSFSIESMARETERVYCDLLHGVRREISPGLPVASRPQTIQEDAR